MCFPNGSVNHIVRLIEFLKHACGAPHERFGALENGLENANAHKARRHADVPCRKSARRHADMVIGVCRTYAYDLSCSL